MGDGSQSIESGLDRHSMGTVSWYFWHISIHFGVNRDCVEVHRTAESDLAVAMSHVWAVLECQSTHYAISANLKRRHLTTSQRGGIASKAMPLLQAEAKERQRDGGSSEELLQVNSPEPIQANPVNKIHPQAREIAAKALGVGASIVQRAAAVDKADPKEFERIMSGETTVEAAYQKAVNGYLYTGSAVQMYRPVRLTLARVWYRLIRLGRRFLF